MRESTAHGSEYSPTTSIPAVHSTFTVLGRLTFCNLNLHQAGSQEMIDRKELRFTEGEYDEPDPIRRDKVMHMGSILEDLGDHTASERHRRTRFMISMGESVYFTSDGRLCCFKLLSLSMHRLDEISNGIL